MAMKVEIKGNKLCIEIDLEKPAPSASGKTMVVASTRGNAVTEATGAELDGLIRQKLGGLGYEF